MSTVQSVLVFAAIVVVALAAAWTFDRWRERRRKRDETLQLLRETLQAPAAQPIDIVDGPHGLPDREIHGLTAPELAETREAFDELIGREWPKQT